MFLCDFAVTCPADTYEVCHVASNLPAYQISVVQDENGIHPPSYAVDGAFQSCSMTNVETNPWWMVDLGSVPLTVTGVFLTSVNLPGA